MPIFYFTFPASSPLKDAYMPVEAEEPAYAMLKMDTTYPPMFWYSCKRTKPTNLYEVPFGYMPEE